MKAKINHNLMKPYGWYFKNRILQFSRLVTNTSVLPSFFIGIVTIWISIYVSNSNEEINLPLNIYLSVFQFNLIVLVSIILTGVIGGRYFFKKQTPEQYAQFSIDGRQEKDAFIYTSYLIWKECMFIESHGFLIKTLDKLIKLKGQANKLNWLFSKSHIEAFNQSVSKRLQNQEIINYSYERLSDNLNLPVTRIADYFFQFNPKIFVSEYRKANNALQEIYLTKDSTNESHCDVQLQRAIFVKDFIKVIKELREFQESIIKYSDLHSLIVGMSGTYGSSNALRTYALGIETIVKNNRDIVLCDKVKFFFHKRRMFPGFDIHIALMNLGEIEDSNSHTPDSSIEKSLIRIYNLNPYELNDYETDISKGLSNIMSIVDSHILIQRKNIVVNFENYLKQNYFDENFNQLFSGNLIFLTQGFSSVVNDTIISILRKFQKDKLLYKSSIRIYLLVDKKDAENSFEKTRYVRYKFKLNPNLPKELNYHVMVKAGNFKWLTKRYNKENNKIILLSGSEFFQEDTRNNKGYRIINNEKSEKVLVDQVKKLVNNGKEIFKHVILAEDYKKFDREISSLPIYRDALNRDHLEYLNLYDWYDERVIITGSKVYQK